MTKQCLPMGKQHPFVSVKKTLQILVADRNPHVRDFLKRELSAEHHEVHLAGSVNELARMFLWECPYDLVILDPYFPEVNGPYHFKELMDTFPDVPIVLHTHLSSMDCDCLKGPRVTLIEKGGQSVDRIKEMILSLQHGLKPSEPVNDELTRMIEQSGRDFG